MSKNHKQIHCEECQKVFITNTSRQRWCSKECRLIGQNRERSEVKRIWTEQNKERVRKSQRKWIDNNPDKRKEVSDSYRVRNTEYYTMKSNERRALNKDAIFDGGDPEFYEFFMKEIYSLRQKRTELTGVVHEVDHIVPLQHARVCGLHTPTNLQIITRFENRSKSNKLEFTTTGNRR